MYMKEHKKNLPELFNEVDKNNDATLSYSEIESFFKKIGLILNDKEKMQFFSSVDSNKDDSIQIKEMVIAFQARIDEKNKSAQGSTGSLIQRQQSILAVGVHGKLQKML